AVRVRTLVDEVDSNAITFRRTDRRSRHLTVVRPRGEENSRRNLEFAIDCEDVVLAKPCAIGADGFAIVFLPFVGWQVGKVPASQLEMRLEALRRDPADRPHPMAGVGRRTVTWCFDGSQLTSHSSTPHQGTQPAGESQQRASRDFLEHLSAQNLL